MDVPPGPLCVSDPLDPAGGADPVWDSSILVCQHCADRNRTALKWKIISVFLFIIIFSGKLKVCARKFLKILEVVKSAD